MGFGQKYYTKAYDEFTARKSANERKERMRLNEVIKKVPEIEGLKINMADTGNRLAKIILSEKNVKEKLSKLEEENLGIQDRIHKLLRQNGFSEDYLDRIYSCKKCKDTGIYEGKRCSCYMDIVKRIAAADLSKNLPLGRCCFDTFELKYYPDENIKGSDINIRSLMKHNLDICREYAENFHVPCDGMVMRGKTGLGKTHLSLSIANEVIDKGYSVVYGSVPDLVRKIEQEHFSGNNNDETAELIQSADLLILDDLGAEFESHFYISTIYDIINSRLNARLPFIISTNCELSELTKRYGERTASRLLSLENLIFLGNDIRMIKNRG